MMTWYTAHYGNWKNGNTVHYIEGTFDRKDMMARAQATADEVQQTVTVSAERGTRLTFTEVHPRVKF